MSRKVADTSSGEVIISVNGQSKAYTRGVQVFDEGDVYRVVERDLFGEIKLESCLPKHNTMITMKR